jgi:hypothetical protein
MSRYISLAYQFFNLTRETINEMEKQGNDLVIVSDCEMTDDESWAKYENETRWSDQNIGVPTLFNFYHGLELLMKGLIERWGHQLKSNHKLTELLATVKEIPEVTDSLIEALEVHLSDGSPFFEFFQENGGNVDKYYELLKYPESKKGEKFNFQFIRGREKEGLKRLLTIRDATIKLKEEIILMIKKNKDGV